MPTRPPISPPKQPIGNPGVIFDKATGLRVLDSTRYTESIRKNKPPERREGGPGGIGLILAFTTSSITPATKSGGTLTYGSGTVQFATDSGTALTAGGASGIPVKNYHDKTIASGAPVALFNWNNKYWIFDAWSCTVLS